jgi:hypothetical protein
VVLKIQQQGPASRAPFNLLNPKCMRENQRGGTYADNTCTGLQPGRNKQENNNEINLHPRQEDSTARSAEMNIAISEGMQYLDIIPRFAL